MAIHPQIAHHLMANISPPFMSKWVVMLMLILLVDFATKNSTRIWAFPSILMLSKVTMFSPNLSIQQINGNFIYQYLWPWTVNNDFSLEFGHLINPLPLC